MTGMEMMLAKMLGISPDEMKATVENAVNLLRNLDARLTNIENMVTEIHSAMFTKGPHVIEGEVLHAESRAAN